MGTLEEHRFKKAILSGGISGEPVYQLADRLCRDVDLGSDLLEFGAGQGIFARRLVEAGYQGAITCADLLPRPEGLPEKIRWFQTDLNDSISLPDASFDSIISTEVLPALENPRFIFREFFRLLRPKGVLIVTNPNQESLRSWTSLILGGHFAAFRGESYPAHISAILHLDFERICAETGFAPPQFYYTDAGGLPKLPQISWQSISFGLLRGRLFSDNMAIVTYKG